MHEYTTTPPPPKSIHSHLYPFDGYESLASVHDAERDEQNDREAHGIEKRNGQKDDVWRQHVTRERIHSERGVRDERGRHTEE